MIEIIVIWRLAIIIGNAAEQKGLKKLGYQIMAVLLWLCGEFFGGILGNVIFGADSSLWLRYVVALLGAIAGAGTAFLVMRFLPKQESFSSQSDMEKKQEISPIKKFGRSGWIPVLIILLAFSCLCACFGMAFIAQMRSMVQQIDATNPIIGTELNSDGQIHQSVTEIPSDTKIIYMSFYFDIPVDEVTAVDFDWSINGQSAYSFSENIGKGQVVTKLDRTQLGLTEFPKGNYEVSARIGTYYLFSASFVVK